MLTRVLALERRSGIGSIIGIAFFLLILLTGYFFYTLMNSDIAAQDRVQSEMRNFDIERSQEKVELSGSITRLGNDLVVNLKNSGSRPVSIAAVGLYDDIFTNWNYSPSIVINDDRTFTLPWGRWSR